MNLEKLKPWNWFRHEPHARQGEPVPVSRDDYHSRRMPADPWEALHRSMDQLLDSTLSRFGHPMNLWTGRDAASLTEGLMAFHPQINIASEEDEYLVTVETPGLNEEDVHLDLQEDLLIIRGDKNQEVETRKRHYYHIERRYGNFQRVLSLPDDASRDDISAHMKDGVLTIRIGRINLTGGEARRIAIDRQ